MSTFRDAIAASIQPAVVEVALGVEGSHAEYARKFDNAIADAVLAMPEMEAIRSFFEWFGHRHGTDADMRYVLRNEASLPDNVVEWVVSHAFGGDQ